jgi:dolichol-phosphate mannosyltransferase
MAVGRETKQLGTQEVIRPKLALIIPALREAENLRGLLERTRMVLARLGVPYEILVVDDDSRDGSSEIIAAIAREDKRVRLLVRVGERGLSGAILHGWRHTEAHFLGVMDADGQHPPELLPALLTKVMDGCDLAIASRYARGAKAGGSNPLRRLASVAASLPALPLQSARLRVMDPLSGYFLVQRRCVEDVLFQPKGFKLLLEILVRGRVHSVEEVPFNFARRKAGRSKLSARVAWDYVSLLAKLYADRYGEARISQEASGD